MQRQWYSACSTIGADRTDTPTQRVHTSASSETLLGPLARVRLRKQGPLVASALPSPQRLPFTMPAFLRVAWSSDRAHLAWSGPLRRIARAMQKLEWMSVAYGVRRAAVVRVGTAEYGDSHRLWSSRGLASVVLRERESAVGPRYRDPSASSRAGTMLIAVGRAIDLSELERAWYADDVDTLGDFFGYPRCCVEAFDLTSEGEGWIDPTWRIAVNSTHARDSSNVIEINGSPVTNSLWRWIGVRATPHVPCRFGCAASIEVASRFIEIGECAGCGEELEWLQDVLSWPVEWSALHGIAEIKTPILRFITRTDATAEKLVVRWKGQRYSARRGTGRDVSL